MAITNDTKRHTKLTSKIKSKRFRNTSKNDIQIDIEILLKLIWCLCDVISNLLGYAYAAVSSIVMVFHVVSVFPCVPGVPCVCSMCAGSLLKQKKNPFQQKETCLADHAKA